MDMDVKCILIKIGRGGHLTVELLLVEFMILAGLGDREGTHNPGRYYVPLTMAAMLCCERQLLCMCMR